MNHGFGPYHLELLMPGIVHPMLRRFREEFKRTQTHPKLTFAQFRILNGIRRGRNQVGMLAGHHFISQPAMSKMVEALVKAGMVTRGTHPEDRRKIELQLTPRALKTVKAIEGKVLTEIAQKISRLSAAEQKIVGDAIPLIASILAEGI